MLPHRSSGKWTHLFRAKGIVTYHGQLVIFLLMWSGLPYLRLEQPVSLHSTKYPLKPSCLFQQKYCSASSLLLSCANPQEFFLEFARSRRNPRSELEHPNHHSSSRTSSSSCHKRAQQAAEDSPYFNHHSHTTPHLIKILSSSIHFGFGKT